MKKQTLISRTNAFFLVYLISLVAADQAKAGPVDRYTNDEGLTDREGKAPLVASRGRDETDSSKTHEEGGSKSPTSAQARPGSGKVGEGEADEATGVTGGPPPLIEKKKKYTRRVFDISLVYPINFFHPRNKMITGFSLNLIYGRTDVVKGLELGGFFNHELEDFMGLQLSVGVNWVGRIAKGFQVAGLFTVVKRRMVGIEIAGLANVVNGRATGLQISGLTSWVTEDLTGVQMSGLMNLVRERLLGYQLGLLLNYAKTFTGLQLGVAFNGARVFKGVQMAGALNVASTRFKGLQLGMINYTKSVHGVQIGLINLCDHLHGVQIGALNIARKNLLPVMILVNAGL